MEMYDSLSKDYDYFVNWPERLAYELPFIEAQIESVRREQPSGEGAGRGLRYGYARHRAGCNAAMPRRAPI